MTNTDVVIAPGVSGLQIMRPAEQVLKPTETVLCRRLVGEPIPVSLPPVCLLRVLYTAFIAFL